jgi:hypothetical protein
VPTMMQHVMIIAVHILTVILVVLLNRFAWMVLLFFSACFLVDQAIGFYTDMKVLDAVSNLDMADPDNISAEQVAATRMADILFLITLPFLGCKSR